MAADVLAVKEKVRRYLTELFNKVEVDNDGDFTFRHNNTRVWASVKPFRDDSTVVKVFAMTNLEVPASPELFKFVATEGTYVFGHLSCRETDKGIAVSFGHSLLGEYLDPEELKVALFMVAGIADTLDDQIKARFGGRFFHED